MLKDGRKGGREEGRSPAEPRSPALLAEKKAALGSPVQREGQGSRGNKKPLGGIFLPPKKSTLYVCLLLVLHHWQHLISSSPQPKHGIALRNNIGTLFYCETQI